MRVVRWILSRRVPPVTRILLIESGSRQLGELAIERLRAVFGPGVEVDALICRPESPAGAAEVWRTLDCASHGGRWGMLRTIRARRHPVAAILASGDPTMAPWKWAAMAALPSKVLIVNENADFFWLDRGHWRVLVQFLRHRSGLGGDSAVRAMARAASFPFALVYLLLYAAWVHTARGFRLLLRLGKRRDVAA